MNLPVVQIVKRPGIIELGWGHPDPALLPADLMRRACDTLLTHTDALEYGYASGPGPLVEWLMERIEAQEGHAPHAEEIMITGGNSLALDQILGALTRPGDTVLVESPTYHLALRILRAHDLNLIAAPADHDGIQTDALASVFADLRRAGKSPRALYTVPTFNNPMGVSLAADRRAELVSLAVEHEFTILEDDVYRELTYDGAAPPSLWSIAPPGVVARMNSFSKTLAPGLRLGVLTAGHDLVHSLTDGPVLDSGGGINHFTAMAVAEICRTGEFDTHVTRLRDAYRARRDALIGVLTESLPDGCSVEVPHGGYFVWVRLPEGMSGDTILPAAETEGVSYVPGSKFSLTGGNENALRLAFSLYPPDQLIEGARRLGRAISQIG